MKYLSLLLVFIWGGLGIYVLATREVVWWWYVVAAGNLALYNLGSFIKDE